MRCEQGELSAALSRIKPTLASHVSLAPQGETLRLVASGPRMRVATAIAATDPFLGVATVPLDIFSRVVATMMTGDLILRFNKTLEVESHMATIKLPVLAGQAGDQNGGLPHTSKFSCKRQDLVVAVASSATLEAQTGIMSGVALIPEDDKIEVVATDGYGVIVNTVTPEGGALHDVVVLPDEVVKALAGLDGDEIEVGTSPYRVYLGDGTTEIVSSVLAGKYPDWRRAESPEYLWTDIHTEELTRAVQSVSTVATGNLVIHLRGEACRVTSSEEGRSAEISVRVRRNWIALEHSVTLNIVRLKRTLSALKAGEWIELGIPVEKGTPRPLSAVKLGAGGCWALLAPVVRG